MRGALAGTMTVMIALAAAAAVVELWSAGGQDAVVREVVDGDTVEMQVAGRSVRVRLLGVDAPSAVDQGAAGQCLGPQATALLRSLLPVGTVARVEFGGPRTDPEGRLLAGVFVGRDRLVNAEMARAGLAAVVEGGDRFAPAVAEAGLQARAARVGLYSPDIACTVPGRVAQLARVVMERPAPPEAPSAADLDDASEEAAVVAETATGLTALLADGWDPLVSGLGGPDRERIRASIDEIRRAAVEDLARLQVAAERQAAQERAARQQEELWRLLTEARPEPSSPAPGPPADGPPVDGPPADGPPAGDDRPAPPAARPAPPEPAEPAPAEEPSLRDRVGDGLRGLVDRLFGGRD